MEGKMTQMSDPRRAGNVQRYHTWEHIKPQTVADHSWNVQRILLAIYPEAPRHLLIHCLVHDVGELVGDIPYPVKSKNPVLKGEMDKLERKTHLSMCIPWGLPAPQSLTDEEKKIFKLAEYLEMWETALFEIWYGNRHMQLVRERCEKAALEIEVPLEVKWRASKYYERRKKGHG